MRIEICDSCKGYGRLKWDVGTHHSEYKYGICSKCNGSGRVEITETTTVKPFKPSGNKSKKQF